MQIKIHRGIDQIGGCITEISSSTSKILIDLGLNLPNGKGCNKDNLANFQSIAKLTQGVDAIFYTHYHSDHIGLMEYVPSDVVQYIGAMAKKIILIKSKFIKNQKTEIFESLKTFVALQKIVIGDISITPFFVSHSAADSYMFLIETDNKKVLHTGDFRDHGYLGKGLAQFIPQYIDQVDVLITEGTMLSRSSELLKTEHQLQSDIRELMLNHKYVFVVSSSTDIDRIATLHKANSKGRLFVCDRYQKKILDIFSANAGVHSDLYKFDDLSVFPKDNLLDEMLAKGFCMMVRPNEFTEGKYWKFTELALRHSSDINRIAIYSMWGGYLDREDVRNINHINFLVKFGEKVSRVHTSGHAFKECLTELCNMTNPCSAIIPIHSECSDEFMNLPINTEIKSKVITKSIEIDGICIVI